MTLPHIFQLTQYDIDRSDSLEPSDIGKWCFVGAGCILGFFDTYEECRACVTEIHR